MLQRTGVGSSRAGRPRSVSRQQPGRAVSGRDWDKLEIGAADHGSRLRVRVRPAARQSEIAGEHGGALKISAAAPPERGKANQEVERLLAEQMGLPRAAVRVVSGHAARDKLVEISGLSPAEIRLRLG